MNGFGEGHIGISFGNVIFLQLERLRGICFYYAL
jgi:hypothetical protein